MNYFQDYEKLKESKQLITIGSVWEDDIGPVEVKGFDGTIVNFKIIPDEDYFSGQYYWPIEKFMKTFTRVE